LPLAAAAVFAAAASHYRDWTRLRPSVLAGTGTVVVAAALWVLFTYVQAMHANALVLTRNFYGALRVQDAPLSAADPVSSRRLVNGSILHGLEQNNPLHWREPLTYYAPGSGVGRLLTAAGKDGPIKVGVIGLGVGTLAAYGRPGDTYSYYEINPAVETIAIEQFHYLATNPARQTVVLGDARLSLEREPAQGYDVLVVDAFISDSIPLHLLTREAFALYRRHLKPGGVLAVHVTNRYVDLAPVVAQAAAAAGQQARLIAIAADMDHGVAHSRWVLATDRKALFLQPELAGARPVTVPHGLKPWTDDYSALWSVLHL
jgi:SAM-dependent methyltransferase